MQSVSTDAITSYRPASAFFLDAISGFLGGGPNSAFFNSLMLSESRGHSQENECCAQFAVFVRDLKSVAAAGGLLGFSRGNGVFSVSVLKVACCSCSCCCFAAYSAAVLRRCRSRWTMYCWSICFSS